MLDIMVRSVIYYVDILIMVVFVKRGVIVVKWNVIMFMGVEMVLILNIFVKKNLKKNNRCF